MNLGLGSTQHDYDLNLTSDDIKGKMNFSDDLRLGYVRKVYGILSVQLLVTVLMSIISMSSNK